MQSTQADETASTGFRGLDGEHHVQIELLAAFRRAVADGRPQHEVDEIFERLIDFTKVHFNSEQLLMRLYQYPSFQQHTDDHDDTVDRLQHMRGAYLAGEHGPACGAADELAERLLAHIRTADRALGSFLVRLGVS